MTVTVQTPLTEYTAAPGATTFATTFRLIELGDLLVTVNGANVTSGFTVSGLPLGPTASVVFAVPMVGGEAIKLQRVIKLERQNNYQFEGDFQANVVNEDFDRLWMSQQDQEQAIDNNLSGQATVNARTLRAPVGEVLNELPAAVVRANKVQAFDSSGQPIAVLPGSGTASEVLINLAGTGAGQGTQAVGHNVAINQIVGTIGWIANNGHIDVGAYPYLVSNTRTATQNSDALDAAALRGSITGQGLKLPLAPESNPILIERKVLTDVLSVIGHSQEQSCIKVVAATPIDYVFKVTRRNETHNFSILCDKKAKAGVQCYNSNGSLIRLVRITGPLLDGIDFLATGNNSGTKVDTCLIVNCGTVTTTGTATGTSGASVVTFVGAPDLTTFVRPGRDIWKTPLNDANRCVEITAVTANTITVYPPLTASFAGATHAIHQGSGIDIQNQGDNSKIVVSNTTIQTCKVAGISNKALYGAYIESCVFEVNEYHTITGTRGLSKPTYGSVFVGNYSEFAFDDTAASLAAYSLGNGLMLGYEGTHAFRYYSGSLLMLELGNDLQQVKQGAPVDGSPAALVFTGVNSQYIKTGRTVSVMGTLTYPTTVTANSAFIDALTPFAPLSAANSHGRLVTTGTGGTDWALVCTNAVANRWGVQTLDGAAVANSALSGRTIKFNVTYFI